MIELKPGLVVGNKEILELHSRSGKFERWKCRCTNCGKVHFCTKSTLEKTRHHKSCNACRNNDCPNFNTFYGGW